MVDKKEGNNHHKSKPVPIPGRKQENVGSQAGYQGYSASEVGYAKARYEAQSKVVDNLNAVYNEAQEKLRRDPGNKEAKWDSRVALDRLVTEHARRDDLRFRLIDAKARAARQGN